MKVGLTGASGLVGGFVLRRLLEEGAEVRALAHRPASADLADGVEQMPGELADTGRLRTFAQGMDAIVHCAYSHVPGRYRGGEGDDRSGFWRTNLLGGIELMESARRAGVSRFVLLSSRAVYGRHSGRGGWVDEGVRPSPDTLYGALKLALEAHASALDADGVCAASLRPTGIYGVVSPVERSKWFDIAQGLAHGRPLPPSRIGTEVHGADVAAAVWLLLTAPRQDVGGRVFNCSDLVADTSEIAKRLAERLGASSEPSGAEVSLRHPMRSSALRALGWKPGGERLLTETLDALAAVVARDGLR